jgi:two-component system response regulator AtoC
MKNSILIIDDEIGLRTSLSLALKNKYTVYAVSDSAAGLRIAEQNELDVCLLDLRLGQEDGVEVCKIIKKHHPGIEVILMTAYGSIQSTVEAMRVGAYNYLTKPLDLNELFVIVEKAVAYKQLSEKVKYLSEELEDKNSIQGIIGKTDCMQTLFRQINRLKDIDAGVMIYGESGTGKELVARALHFSGYRKGERFVDVNCAAIPENLLEEELFGHKKGAFTGAVTNKIGKFEYAENGTIFLDEIGDMPLNLQAKLLRVLENREYTPIGSNEMVSVKARVVAATNRNLKELVKEGKFRQDLYFRLHVVHLMIPSLRSRKADIPLLVDHFIRQYNEKKNTGIRNVRKAAIKCLMEYDYPGNVRELFNILEYAAIFRNNDDIDFGDLPMDRLNNAGSQFANSRTLAEAERVHVLNCLKENNGNVPITAKILGISDKGLRNKLDKYQEEGWVPL